MKRLSPHELFQEFVEGFPNRKFSAGLLVAFIDFLQSFSISDENIASFADFLEKYPRQLETAGGKRANTLIVAKDAGSTVSLRPFYNRVEHFFRAEHKRFDYPSCAPHATQAWNDYEHWLESLIGFDDAELIQLRTEICTFVLDTLKDQRFDPGSIEVDPPLFKLLLEGFALTSQKGEPSGAAYQGVVFGFLRADNPHLQLEVAKVRAGSKRLQRVGDIDGWEGARLAVSAEVKQIHLRGSDQGEMFAAFAHETGVRGAVGIVAALSFDSEAREAIDSLGLHARDLNDLLTVAEVWDPIKQRIATTSFAYYVHHVEKNASLVKRLAEFIQDASAKSMSRTPEQDPATGEKEDPEVTN